MADEVRAAEASEPRRYEPPKIEGVLTADDLVREVLYAGISISER